MRYGPLVLALLVAACTTPEQIAQQRQWDIEEDINRCTSYGLRPGTEAFAQCRMELDLMRERAYYPYYHDYHHGPHFGTGIHYYTR